jgi:hypothetical protein
MRSDLSRGPGEELRGPAVRYDPRAQVLALNRGNAPPAVICSWLAGERAEGAAPLQRLPLSPWCGHKAKGPVARPLAQTVENFTTRIIFPSSRSSADIPRKSGRVFASHHQRNEQARCPSGLSKEASRLSANGAQGRRDHDPSLSFRTIANPSGPASPSSWQNRACP